MFLIFPITLMRVFLTPEFDCTSWFGLETNFGWPGAQAEGAALADFWLHHRDQRVVVSARNPISCGLRNFYFARATARAAHTVFCSRNLL